MGHLRALLDRAEVVQRLLEHDPWRGPWDRAVVRSVRLHHLRSGVGCRTRDRVLSLEQTGQQPDPDRCQRPRPAPHISLVSHGRLPRMLGDLPNHRVWAHVWAHVRVGLVLSGQELVQVLGVNVPGQKIGVL